MLCEQIYMVPFFKLDGYSTTRSDNVLACSNYSFYTIQMVVTTGNK